MEGRLELRRTLERKGLRTSRGITEYIEYGFEGKKHRVNRDRHIIELCGEIVKLRGSSTCLKSVL